MADKYDIIIIGGGVIGLCSAFYLQQSGARVAVLDKGDYIDGASWVNAGLLVPSHLDPIAAPGVISQGIKWLADPESPFYIKPRVDVDLTKWLWGFQASCTEKNVERAVPVLRDLAFASLRLYDEIAELPGFDGMGLAHSGLMMLHNSPKSEKSNLGLADMADRAGVKVERLTRQETLEREPGIRTPMDGSIYFEEDCAYDPEAFMRLMSNHLMEQGVDVLSFAEVSGFKQSDGEIKSVETTKGPIRGDNFLLCAGSWSGILAKKLGFRLAIQPATGYSITVENPGSELKIPVIVTDEKVTVTPMNNRIRIGGTLTLVGHDTTIPNRRTLPLQRQARLYCSEYDSIDTPLPATRSGFRPCSTDGLPVIGRPKGWKNLVVATGHGMLGMTQGPITGKLVTDLFEGSTPQMDLSPLSPDRF